MMVSPQTDSTGFRRKQSFLNSAAPLLHKKKTVNPIVVTVANGEWVQSTHDGALDISGLPPGARYAHVIPGFKHSLLSIERLCNAGCKMVFSRWGLNVEVRYRGKVVMKGRKSTINGLLSVWGQLNILACHRD